MKYILTALLFTATLLVAAPQNLTSPEIMSLRMMGMGGASTAVADDEELLSVNPAGLAQRMKHFQTRDKHGILSLPVLNFQLGVPGPLVDTLGYVSSNFLGGSTTSFLANPASTTSLVPLLDLVNRLDRVPLGVLLSTPINFGYIGYKWGFNFRTLIDARVTTLSGLPPSASLYNQNAVEFKLGFAPIDWEIVPGISLKVGAALKILGFSRVDQLFDLGTAMTLLGASQSGLAGILPFVNSNVIVAAGGGLNIGALLSLSRLVTIGFSVIDAPAIVARASVTNFDATGAPVLNWAPQALTPDIRAGVAVRLPNLLGDKFLANIVLAADLTHLFNSDYSLFTMLHLGASCDVINFRFLGIYAAAGLNKGYGTFSAGFKLGPLRLGYAFWQDELGLFANTHVDQKHMAELALRF